MREIYEKICAGEDLRANLIELKRQLKIQENREEFREICGEDHDVIMRCLVDDDPKVRKNAADILGALKVQESVDVLMDAYREEETRFVRADYVSALSELDCAPYMEEFHARLDELCSMDAAEDETKHVQAEIAALRELILKKEGIKKHPFTGYNQSNEVLLTTLPAFRGLLAADLPFQKKERPDGIVLSVGDMDLVSECRYWQEMLFVISVSGKIPAQAEAVAAALTQSDLMEILNKNHSGREPYYFRVGVGGYLNREERSTLAKQAGAAIGQAFSGSLLNSPSHYEVEIRLNADREGMLTPYLKLFTLPDNRFCYRRYHVSAGLRPYIAAGLIGLAKPYLKENAQVLDPFCGAGTLLIERRYAGPVRSTYGIDTFGEAIEKARRNAQIAGMPVNYINRNFFDFTHDYLFDEIITDMPDPVGDRAETDALYRAFFEKSAGLLAERGRIFCYTKETGLLKKHLRLNGQFRLLKEFPVLEKSKTGFFIMERRKSR